MPSEGFFIDQSSSMEPSIASRPSRYARAFLVNAIHDIE